MLCQAVIILLLKSFLYKRNRDADCRLLHRIQEVPHEGPMCDLLWSDPDSIDGEKNESIYHDLNSPIGDHVQVRS